MKLLASLVLGSLGACAGTPAPSTTPTPAPVTTASCAPGGLVMFEIDHRTAAASGDTSTAILYASGAWTYDDSTGAHRAGCVNDVEALRTQLAAAPWQTAGADEIHCMAMSASFVDYVVFGKHVWTARLCDPTHLDATSQHALDTAIATLTTATKA